MMNDMMNVNMVVNVEMNDECGGYIVCRVIGNDGIERFVYFGFDYGDSLGIVELVEKKDDGEFSGYGMVKENLDEIYGEDEVNYLWDMEWMNEE